MMVNTFGQFFCAFSLILFDSVNCQAIIGNDDVILGVASYGNLNVNYYVGGILNLAANDVLNLNRIGLRNGINVGGVAGQAASTEPGCLCEGWGIGVDYLDGTTAMYEESSANAADGYVNIVLESFSGNDGDTTATSVIQNGAQNLYQVTHYFEPHSQCNSAYEAKVTITNISPHEFDNVQYVRVMDWDIYPNFYREHITIQGAEAAVTAGTLLLSNDNGFCSANPSETCSERLSGTTNVDFEDSGPADHGAYFKFSLGGLGSGNSMTFSIAYGVTGNEADAISCLNDIDAEIYSLGQSSSDDNEIDGEPYTFFFAFTGLPGLCSLNYSPFDCPREDSLCENSPCDCGNIYSEDYDPNCNICHSNGCDECKNGYFKVDYNHNCVSCSEYFGDGCMFCQDHNGCGQCESGYLRYYDEECGLWYCDNGECVDKADTSATECENLSKCENSPCGIGEVEFCTNFDYNGCSQCHNGYFKKDNDYPCINCQQVFGSQCLFCQDYNGCAQCENGFNRVYNSECGLWECQ